MEQLGRRHFPLRVVLTETRGCQLSRLALDRGAGGRDLIAGRGKTRVSLPADSSVHTLISVIPKPS